MHDTLLPIRSLEHTNFTMKNQMNQFQVNKDLKLIKYNNQKRDSYLLDKRRQVKVQKENSYFMAKIISLETFVPPPRKFSGFSTMFS